MKVPAPVPASWHPWFRERRLEAHDGRLTFEEEGENLWQAFTGAPRARGTEGLRKEEVRHLWQEKKKNCTTEKRSLGLTDRKCLPSALHWAQGTLAYWFRVCFARCTQKRAEGHEGR